MIRNALEVYEKKNVKWKNVKWKNVKKLKLREKNSQREIERHHLLRCTKDQCKSRWWNRNIAGSFNILTKFVNDVICQNGILEKKPPGTDLTRRHPLKSIT